MNLPLFRRPATESVSGCALIYRFADAGLAGTLAGFSSRYPDCRHFDCDHCSAADLCGYRELAILLRGEDLLGVEFQWREAQFWLRALPLKGRCLSFYVLQRDNLLEPELCELLAGLRSVVNSCGADVSVCLLSSVE